jgi:hypothetical protein
MFLPKAHKALFLPILCALAACGDPGAGAGLGIEAEVDSTNAAIVGGWAATTEQIFATVEIRRTGAASGFCSGALISSRLVATAAHCAVIEPEPGIVEPASPSSLRVVAGHLSSSLVDGSMVRAVEEIAVHESYDHDFVMGRSRSGAGKGGIGSPNDLALLFLSIPFEGIPNAPMLDRTEAEQLVRHGDLGFVAGYGVYDVEADLSGELYISDAIIDILGERELLTRRPDQLGDSCFGDSGGPFYVPTEYGDFLVGLVSRGRSDVSRDCGDGGVYTLLSAYLPWIVQTAGDRFAPRLLPGTQPVAFRPPGAETYTEPTTAELRGIRSCEANQRNYGDTLPTFLLFIGLIWVQRRFTGAPIQ